MNNKIKHIIREVPPEDTDFGLYFDDEGLTSAGGDYYNNLFIVNFDNNASGFNMDEFKRIQNEIENLLEMYIDIVDDSDYKQYSNLGQMLYEHGLLCDLKNTKRIKAFKDFFTKCNETPSKPYSSYYNKFEVFNSEMTAEYLTLKTGKKWDTDSARGYSQGDYVAMIYCPEFYTNGVEHYGEIWLGTGKEFYIIELDENGEEVDTCSGYIIADCQVSTDEDYKKLVCKWAEIPENETQLELIESSKMYIKYSYRTV